MRHGLRRGGGPDGLSYGLYSYGLYIYIYTYGLLAPDGRYARVIGRPYAGMMWNAGGRDDVRAMCPCTHV